MLDADPTPAARPGRRPDGRGPGRGRRTALALALVAALGASGCGGDDDKDEATDGGATLTAADARAADTSAKEGAREIMAAVESCFRGARDYAACRQPQRIGSTQLTVVPDDPGVSEATVSRATPTGYRILTVSLSGNRFAITRQGSQVIRSCAARTEVGKAGGGCAGNGW
jgi:hypothetical protein